MKKPFPPKKATGKKVFEYEGAMKSASEMMKKEKRESKSKEMAEGKSYKVGSKPMSTSRDSMSSTKAMDPKKKPASTMSKPPKESFSLGKTLKKATSTIKKAVKGPKKTGLNRYM
jgi:hypothetical protein